MIFDVHFYKLIPLNILFNNNVKKIWVSLDVD